MSSCSHTVFLYTCMHTCLSLYTEEGLPKYVTTGDARRAAELIWYSKNHLLNYEIIIYFFFPHNKCVEICLCLFTVNILWTHGIGPQKQELWHVTKLIVIWRHLIVLKIGLIGEKKPHFSLLPSALFCSWGLLLQLRITSKRGWRFLELQEEDLKDFLNTYN